MGIDSGPDDISWATAPSVPHGRRMCLTPMKLRLKEERKKVIRALETKYRTIDDHERGMRRFVLIRNNLRRLQREAREEKLARHRNGLGSCRVSNLSPSCLSTTRPHTGTDSSVTELSPLSFGSSDVSYDEDPLPKRQRLFFDDDKENEMDVEAERETDPKIEPAASCRQAVDDAQEILRDLYETCVSEGITPVRSTHSCPSRESPSLLSHSLSLSLSASCSLSSTIEDCSSSSNSYNAYSNNNVDSNSNSMSHSEDWPRLHSQYPFNCGQSSLLGNDLQSVVFHSLITSLES